MRRLGSCSFVALTPRVSGRVIEDRRFGIYDARRYRLPDGTCCMSNACDATSSPHADASVDDPEADGEEDLDAQGAVVVKSYRDSATFKRRHGLALTEDGEDAQEEEGMAAAAGARKRPRLSDVEAQEATRFKGPPASAPGPGPKSRSGRAKPATQKAAVAAMPEAAAPAPALKQKKSGTRPTKAAREAAAAAAAAAGAAGAAGGGDAAPGEARPEDGIIWRLQFKRGWGRTATRTALHSTAAGGSAPLAPPAAGLRRELAERHAGRAHPTRSGALAHAGGGSGGGGHDGMLHDVMPRHADAGDDSDAGGAGDDALLTVPWHIGAE